MQPIIPSVTVPDDTQDRIMARSGHIVGFTKSRVVWQFGFMYDSDAHKAYGVFIPYFIWIIADYSGKILETYEGYAMALPVRFKNIINGLL